MPNIKVNKPNNNGTSNKTNLPQKPTNPTVTQELLNQIIITNRIIAKELKEIKEIQAQLLNEIKSIRYRLSIYNNKNKKVISVAELIEKLLAIFNDEESIENINKKETQVKKQVNKEEVEDIEEIQETVETQEETEEEDETIIIDDL